MATEAQRVSFIKEVAPCAVYAHSVLGKVLPSICIAMACVESAYGTSSIMRKNNAFLGQKVGTGRTATKYWSKGFFVAKTKEEYTVGTHTIIKDAFRSYDNMQQCIMNYYELLNTKLYSKVKAGVDFETQMNQIKACGYMTSSTEVRSVITLIKRYNLTAYDTGTEPVFGSKTERYSVGKTYTLEANMYIRNAPNGKKLTMNDITENAKEHAYADIMGKVILKKGTKVTCKELNTEKGTWMRIPSGWICAVASSGKVFIS